MIITMRSRCSRFLGLYLRVIDCDHLLVINTTHHLICRVDCPRPIG